MNFTLNEEKGYFKKNGVQITAFSDFYPAGRQSGIGLIMHGHRVASNGDVRFEPTPGQWQPVPKKLERDVNIQAETITTTLLYPDKDAHLKGFNPIIYPDFEFTYQVCAKADGEAVLITVDLDREIPQKYLGKLCFNLEFYPGDLFGKAWIMDDKHGIFPRQPNGPTIEKETNFYNCGHFKDAEEGVSPEELAGMKGSNSEVIRSDSYQPIIADDIIGKPYAEGHVFTACPEDKYRRVTIESKDTVIKLYDGRMNHNNGWFTISSELPTGKTKNALVWRIIPNAVENWVYDPVIQVSQVGYHTGSEKIAVIETDPMDSLNESGHAAKLIKFTANGEEEVFCSNAVLWGDFLRYKYYKFDFSSYNVPGLYTIQFRNQRSDIFKIGKDVYDRGVWQPVLEYFLPIQMCHMEVREKYRLWHGHCHRDDARMAPLNRNHFDGYRQGPSSLTRFKSGDVVPGLNVGGWHDAGDFDLRVESQSGECYILALAYEEFGVDYDCNTIDQRAHRVEIHQPDGKNDILQQIEHGALSVVGGYKALGRLYRGIICKDLRQYVLLGDPAGMTNGISGDDDDRLVFTEENPWRELSTVSHLAAIARVMKGFNNTLSEEALNAAIALFNSSETGQKLMEGKAVEEEEGALSKGMICIGLQAVAELLLTTDETAYMKALSDNQEFFYKYASDIGWVGARIVGKINDTAFKTKLKDSLVSVSKDQISECELNPYGVPYKPVVYGAGWGIQSMAFRYYFLNRVFPELFDGLFLERALNFILGCHPGSNTASFASGIGTRSMTVAYGLNRADWSYVPGGVVSGTALIRPDLPELLDFPYLWQQAEYVLGGGSSNYMFLVLAVIKLLQG